MSGDRRYVLSASGRVLLAMSAMITATVAVLVLIGYGVTARALTAELDASLEREAQAYSAAMRGAPATETLAPATRAYLRARTPSGAGRDVVLLLRLQSGRTISNSDVRLENAPGNPVGAWPPKDSSYADVVLEGVTYRTLTMPVRSAGEVVGAYQAAIAQQAVTATARRVALTLGATGLLALAVMLPLSYWATRGALAPLRRMATDAEKISHAEPGGRIAYDGPEDELGSLAQTLNAMLTRLESAYAEQRRFVADASHELRTPVAVIRGNVELLRAQTLEESDRAESLATIEEEVVRMTRLLDELLSLARYDAGQPAAFQPLNVRVMLEEAAARARTFGERRIRVDGACDLWIEGDPDLLDQVLINLTRNAIAHTTEGGSIVFSCSTRQDRVVLVIADDGPGIPPDDLERVFDRFYRAPAARREGTSGAGLGLAITRRIVELHGGTVAATNVDPHGARFTIELPAAPEAASEGTT